MKLRQAAWHTTLALAALAVSCGGIDNSMNRKVADAVTLTSEWKSFRMEPPLSVEKTGQKIRMELDGVKDWERPEGALLLSDGSRVNVDVELVDQTGQRHALTPVSIGPSIGFGPGRPESGAGFNSGRKFTEVRVRSSKPVVAKNIDWYCWVGK